MGILTETKALLDMAAAQGGPKLHEMEPATARELMAPMVAMLDLPPINIKEVRDLSIPSPAGNIPARLFVPTSGQGDGPVLVHFHGGGWVLGSVDGSDSACRYIAERLRFRVVSVDYRMAPEHVFPAAFDDCLAATNWVASSPSRAYKKNDQAFVEQKNGAVVRRLVGYGRFDGLETTRVLERLYAASRLHTNFFQPSFKMKYKRREGAKVIKRYHVPATPASPNTIMWSRHSRRIEPMSLST
jgi:alpha/beta hydrolase fold